MMRRAKSTLRREDGKLRKVAIQGVRVPVLGLGTLGLSGEVARRIVSCALDMGYRHIDTAQIYGNESEIGDAINGASVRREHIWLTTKVWPDRFKDGDLQRSVERSVRKLKTEPDLLLLHWPNSRIPLRETIGALNDVKREGLTKHIGISNFTVALMRQALSLSEEPLLLNQIEYHPYIGQQTVLRALRASDMALTAYSPLARGRVFRDSRLRRIGERFGKSPGQVTLRWLIQQDGVIAIPRSSCESNLRSNLEIFDFELAAPEMAEISALAGAGIRLVDPIRFAPTWDDLDAMGHARRNATRVLRAVIPRVRRLFQ